MLQVYGDKTPYSTPYFEGGDYVKTMKIKRQPQPSCMLSDYLITYHKLLFTVLSYSTKIAA